MTAIIIALLLFFILRTQNINLKQRNVILQKEQEVDRLTLEKNRAEREQLEKDILATEKLNALEQERMKQETDVQGPGACHQDATPCKQERNLCGYQ